jgi:hypothetical protein
VNQTVGEIQNPIGLPSWRCSLVILVTAIITALVAIEFMVGFRSGFLKPPNNIQKAVSVCSALGIKSFVDRQEDEHACENSIAAVRLWLTMVAVQVVVWVIVTAWLSSIWATMFRRRLIPYGRLSFSLVAPAIVLSCSALVLYAGGSPISSLPPLMNEMAHRLRLISTGGYFAAAASIVSAYLLVSVADVRPEGVGVQHFAEIHTCSRNVFLAASVILALGVMGGAVLRRACSIADGITFPADSLVIFGLLLSLVLFACYLPVEVRFFAIGDRLLVDSLGCFPKDPQTLSS